MAANDSSDTQSRRPRYQFGLASLFHLTFLVACILAVTKWIGPFFGWVAAVPLGIIAILLLCTHWHCIIGTVVGFAVLSSCLIAACGMPNVELLKNVVAFGSFGGAIGASVHAILLWQCIAPRSRRK